MTIKDPQPHGEQWWLKWGDCIDCYEEKKSLAIIECIFFCHRTAWNKKNHAFEYVSCVLFLLMLRTDANEIVYKLIDSINGPFWLSYIWTNNIKKHRRHPSASDIWISLSRDITSKLFFMMFFYINFFSHAQYEFERRGGEKNATNDDVFSLVCSPYAFATNTCPHARELACMPRSTATSWHFLDVTHTASMSIMWSTYCTPWTHSQCRIHKFAFVYCMEKKIHTHLTAFVSLGLLFFVFIYFDFN